MTNEQRLAAIGETARLETVERVTHPAPGVRHLAVRWVVRSRWRDDPNSAIERDRGIGDTPEEAIDDAEARIAYARARNARRIGRTYGLTGGQR